MKCNSCGYNDFSKDKFVGIFATGTTFLTSNGDVCGLFGCPKCHSVQYVADIDYINRRKDMYKNRNK